MNNLDMMKDMYALQDKMNSQINPEWRTAGYKYLRAAWKEASEMMDHIGWKWWKKQELDLPQAQMELVDIWHFLVSEAIRDELTPEQLLLSFTDTAVENVVDEYGLEDEDVNYVIELFVQSILDEGVFVDYYSIFNILCDRLELPFADLYRQYIGKNVLNFFRQYNGYKEGTYVKVWSGKEDNVYLAEILNTIPDDITDVQAYIHGRLESSYQLYA